VLMKAGTEHHRVRRTFQRNFTPPMGYDPAVVETANFEAFTKFTWDGEVGHGLTQRSVKER
jgi:hypothetical protein